MSGRPVWPRAPPVPPAARNVLALGSRRHRRDWAGGYDGRRIEPDEAIWKLFILIYGIYWLFLANIGLCGAVERHLRRNGARSTTAPSTLAFIACLVQLVPVLNLIVSPVLWAVFMARVDAVQAEADALDPGAPPPAPMGLLKTLAIIVGGLLFGWIMLVVVFLAIWQFLNPGRS